MKDLLVFAHRGEAQSFLTSDVKPLSFQGFFEGSKYYLLITGEGPFQSLSKTNAFLGLNSTSIDKVINLGIAGSYNSTIPKNKIVSIRTCYAYIGNQPQFKSYTSADKNAIFDIVTTDKRVLSNENKHNHLPMGELVDKETWGILQSAHFFNKEAYAYKLISDHIEEGTICTEIKNQAIVYSNQLKSFYEEISQSTRSKEIKRELPDIFYATTYQSNKWKKLTERLSEQVFQSYHNKETFQKLNLYSLSPKKRMSTFLNHLEECLYPEKVIIKKGIEKSLLALKSTFTNISYDTTFEREQLQINASIEDSEQLNEFISRLQSFEWKNYQKCFEKVDPSNV